VAPDASSQVVAISGVPAPRYFFRDQIVSGSELFQALGGIPPGERSLVVKADRTAPLEQVMEVVDGAQRLGYQVILATSPKGE
jgi:biopolymer transport protein ExbD